MCLLEKRKATTCPLNMTLTARLSPPNACVEVGVPKGSWSAGKACCPNCKLELKVSLTPSVDKCADPQAPSPFTFQPTYLPQIRLSGKGTDSHTPTTYPFQPTYLPESRLSSFGTDPQSPSPILFQLPQIPLYTAPQTPLLLSACNEELRRLTDTLRALRLSGWYYGNLDWQGARTLLKNASVGAFVVRDSGDKNFIFSLSVQTEKGPTSVRLHFEEGFFRLDCDWHVAKYMPRFRCVVELIQHYTRLGEQNTTGTVWVDSVGCPHSAVILKTPLRKSPPSLLHSARLAVHRALDSNPLRPKLWCAPKHRLLPLPSTVIDYLGEYPYSI